MSFSGGGEQPTHIPSRQHSEPPIRGPEDPHGDTRYFWEQVLKWSAIGVFALFLLIGFAMILNCETEPTPRQMRLTVEAERTEDAGNEPR